MKLNLIFVLATIFCIASLFFGALTAFGVMPDSYEPDDNWSQASYLQNYQNQYHTITPATDVDWATFTISQESTVVIETAGPRTDDTRMWLFDSDLNLIEYDNDSGIGSFSLIDRVCGTDPLPAGTYHVKIDENNNDSEIPGYNLSLTVSPCTVWIFYVDDDAPNDPGPGDTSVSDPNEDGTTNHPFDAIQEAVNAASSVSNIFVRAGIYNGTGNRDIDILGKNVCIVGMDRDNTIIDCQAYSGNEHRAFYFANGETWQTTISSLTIRNGYMNEGGAIFCSNSSPTIMDCVFEYNSNPTGSDVPTDSGGGAFYGMYCDSDISYCIFRNNNAGYRGGGGICLMMNSNATISNCTFAGNYTWGYGGAIALNNSTPVISGCSMFSNSSDNFGGAFYASGGGNIEIRDCIISSNIDGLHSAGGGAICLSYNTDATIKNCVITDNIDVNFGTVINCYTDCDPYIENCTIARNTGDSFAKGTISSENNSFPVILNSILWENSGAEISYDGTSLPHAYACDIEGATGSEPWYNAGCISKDPLFIYPEGNDYRLANGSPCIDMAIDDYAPDFDINGRPRYDDPTTPNIGFSINPPHYLYYDIGAYEFKGYYVNDINGDDSYDGLYPQPGIYPNGPKKTIQYGLYSADPNDSIIVAPGTYTGSYNHSLSYNGKDIILTSEKGALQTIIDCEGGNNLRGFLFNNYESRKALLKGFTIANGNSSLFGGGIFCNIHSNPTILECVIKSNSAAIGAGVACYNSGPLLADCTITMNSASNWGGGFSCNSSSYPTLRNCLIYNNIAQTTGGGLYSWYSDLTLMNCTVYGNSAGSDGGGIYYGDYGLTITDCILWNDSPNEIGIYGDYLYEPLVSYSDVQNGTGQLWFGTGCIDTLPYFAAGPLHDFYLCHSDLQGIQSPCVDAGSNSVEVLRLQRYLTRTDGVVDTGIVDMGYHAKYALRIDNIWRSGGNVAIHWNAISGISYVVEWSTDLVSWNEISVGAVTQWTDTDTAGYAKKFYRIREE